MQREPPVHPHHDGLAWAEPPADKHLGVEPGRGLQLAAHDQQQPARMGGGGGRRRCFGLTDVALVGYDDEGEHACEGQRAGSPALGG